MKQRVKIKQIAMKVLFLVLVFSSLVSARIIYVDDDASGLNDGSSWVNAYNYLQDALSEAEYSNKPIEIRVAQGIYTPDKGENITPEDRYETFELQNDVTLSGGYAGYLPYDSNIEPDTRDIELYQSILSGDLYNNDSNDFDPNNILTDPNFSDNSLNVVWSYSNDSTSVLDGFTISAGIARGNNDEYYFQDHWSCHGGGIYIESSGPVITNCIFTINAAFEGGAIYITDSDPNIQNCKFIRNNANYYYSTKPEVGNGGAIYNTQSDTILTNCEFIENLASSGAGVFIFDDSNMVIKNCQFNYNTANVSSGGGIRIFDSSPIINECYFSKNNSAQYGGAILIYDSSPIINECFFYDNNSVKYGGAIASQHYSSPDINNCTFYKNSANTSGGAIINQLYSDANITNCLFIENFARIHGGAITIEDSNPKLESCTFMGNNSYYNSGALSTTHSNPVFTSCVFSNNSAVRAGVIMNVLGNPVFENCIFSGNFDYISAGVLYNAGGYIKIQNCTFTGNYSLFSHNTILNDYIDYKPTEDSEYSVDPFKLPGTIEILNSIIWNEPTLISNLNGSDITISYSDIYGGISAIYDPNNNVTWGPGNIDDDPLFVNDGFWVDINDPNIIVEPNDPNAFWLEGDYHLQSTAGHYDPNNQLWFLDDVNSPCIDSGNPNSSFENEPLPNGGRINMGAYGGTIEASLSYESPTANKEPETTEDL